MLDLIKLAVTRAIQIYFTIFIFNFSIVVTLLDVSTLPVNF